MGVQLRHELAGIMFKSQISLKLFVKSLIADAKDGAISEPDTEFGVFRDLLRRHPAVDRAKEADRVTGFCVRPHPVFGHRELCYILPTGKVEPFSWNKCVTKRGHSPAQEVQRALRAVVWTSCERPPKPIDCQTCGVHTDELELDHVDPTFKTLVGDFLDNYPISKDDIVEDADTRLLMLKPGSDFFGAWVKHHDSLAKMMWVCKPCHRVKTYTKQRREPAEEGS